MQDLFIILIIGFILSLGIVAIVMPFYIRLLKSLHYEQRVSEYALEEGYEFLGKYLEWSVPQ